MSNSRERLTQYIQSSKTEEIEKLITSDSTLINQENEDGKTPLQEVVWVLGNDIQLITFLLNKGAEVNPENHWYSPLQLALQRGADIKLVRLFVDRRADVNYFTTGSSPLDQAARNGDIEAFKFLLEYGAEPDRKNNEPTINSIVYAFFSELATWNHQRESHLKFDALQTKFKNMLAIIEILKSRNARVDIIPGYVHEVPKENALLTLELIANAIIYIENSEQDHLVKGLSSLLVLNEERRNGEYASYAFEGINRYLIQHFEDKPMPSNNELQAKIEAFKKRYPQNDPIPDDKELTKDKIVEKLDEYINRIKSHTKNEEIDFSAGFSLFKTLRAKNRQANYNVAMELKQQLQDANQDNTNFSSENIKNIRKNIVNADKKLYTVLGIFSILPGIRSKQLNSIIRDARSQIKI